jgi:phytoene dehydrogenase-like protein
LAKREVPWKLFDAADAVGGRVRTDVHPDGFLLDRGFQVFLDSYPEAKKVLDYKALRLRAFEPGALTRIDHVDATHLLVDPFRRPLRAVAVAFSAAATTKDRWLVAKLRREVTRGEADKVLTNEEPRSMRDFLRDYGFSDRIIESFFRPFFGGVFLDRSLSTSAKLFLWLFRLFSVGSASLPAEGMGAIPTQLAAAAERLGSGEIRLKTTVDAVFGDSVTIDGQTVAASATVLATDRNAAADLLKDRVPKDFNTLALRETLTFYFAADKPLYRDNLLYLAGDDHHARPINTIAQLSVAQPSYAPDGKVLISVNVVDVPEHHQEYRILGLVRNGLVHLFGNKARQLTHLRTYHVQQALPSQTPPTMKEVHKPTDLSNGLYVAGDYRDTASINGAMLSGRRAAEAVMDRLGVRPKPAASAG